jgi:diguanylate cyclase (GGDEF)-like protein
MQTTFEHSKLITAGIYTSQGVSPSSIKLFREIMLGISILAFFTHALFAAMFAIGGVIPMVFFNAVSMACYGLVHWLAKRGKPMLAWWITMIEVLGHAAAATIYVGWESGFHWYALLVLPVLLFSFQNFYRVKLPLASILIAIYLVTDFYFRSFPGLQPLPTLFVSVLHTANLGVFLCFLAFLCHLYNMIVESSERKLSEYASTDPLTGLKNRRAITACLEIEASRQRRNNQTMSLVLCDVDYFKKVNDTAGHEAGDAVLRAVGDVLQTSIRLTDAVGRWGGEEFLIILPETPAEKAVVVCERIQARLATLLDSSAHLRPYKNQLNPITMTFGISEMSPDEKWGTYFDAIERADKLLYAGKNAGRNRIMRQ